MTYSRLTSKSILLLGILVIFYSCKGQVKAKEENEILNQNTIGRIVDEFPQSAMIIYQDYDSNYWFTGNGNGVFLYDGIILKQFTQKDGLASDQIRAFQEDKLGNIYFDTPLE